MEKYRQFLKAHDWKKTPEIVTDQQKEVPPPPFQKPCPEESSLIDLIPQEEFSIDKIPLIYAINNRKSRRGYTNDPLTLEELSFLLWATQGVREIDTDRRHGNIKTTKRTVPSGGSHHPYETFLAINRVERTQSGIYPYLEIEYKQCNLTPTYPDLPNKMVKSCYDQKFTDRAVVVFI